MNHIAAESYFFSFEFADIPLCEVCKKEWEAVQHIIWKHSSANLLKKKFSMTLKYKVFRKNTQQFWWTVYL
jgi:hypothetical protein